MTILLQQIDDDGATLQVKQHGDSAPLLCIREENEYARFQLPKIASKIDDLIEMLESYKQTLENNNA